MKSVRSFLLTRLLGGAVVVLLAAGAAVYVAVTGALERQFDRRLADRVLGFASLLFQVEDHVEFEFSDQLMPDYQPGERAAYFQLWRGTSVLERSDSLRRRDLPLPSRPGPEPSFWSAPLPDGRLGRYVSQEVEVHHLDPEEGPLRPQAARIAVVVALGREELVAAERIVLLDCALMSLLVIALIAAVCWRAVSKGLEPTRRLASVLDAIEADRLPRHLEVGELPRELKPVAEKADALLQRLDAALKRERRTSADIAHELRTPISEVITVAEVALRKGRDAEVLRRALGTVRDTAWRMGRSLSTLLKLARLEMGAETFDAQGVDLGAIVAELRHSLAAVERERELRIEQSLERPAQVEADEDALRIVAANLLGNAVAHAPARGSIAIRLEGSGSAWSFVVENDAGDLRPEDLRHLAEPFWRKEGARSDRERSGLGLALSRALAEKTGMELAFALEGGRFRASLSRRAPAEPAARKQREHAAALSESGSAGLR